MNAVVVYESHWGNTAAVARAIAAGIGPDARALATDEASTEALTDVDLVVAGAPVIAFRLASDKMLEEHARPIGQSAVSTGSSRIRRCAPGSIGCHAARAAPPRSRPGSGGPRRGATSDIERRLEGAGYPPIARAQRFVVKGTLRSAPRRRARACARMGRRTGEDGGGQEQRTRQRLIELHRCESLSPATPVIGDRSLTAPHDRHRRRPSVHRRSRAGRPCDFVTFGSCPRAGRHLSAICAYVDSRAMDEITILQAEVLKTLASPRRLEILHVLAQRPDRGRVAWRRSSGPPSRTSRSISPCFVPPASSRRERDGREVRYRLSDPDVMVACGVMRAVLERRLTRLGRDRRRVDPRVRRHRRPAQPARGDAMDEPLNLVLFSGHRRQAAGGRGPDRRRRRARQAGQRVPPVLGARRLPGRPDRRRPRARPGGRRRQAAPRSTACEPPDRRAGPRRFARPRSSAASTSRPARCPWTCSTSSQTDLDPLVDGVEGVTAFYLNAGEGQVVFI